MIAKERVERTDGGDCCSMHKTIILLGQLMNILTLQFLDMDFASASGLDGWTHLSLCQVVFQTLYKSPPRSLRFCNTTCISDHFYGFV